VTAVEVTHGERAAWQLRAAGELARILDAHRDLPVIPWTVGAAGSVLVGQIFGTPTAAGARASLEAWRVALALPEHHEHAGRAVTYLSARGYCNHVRVVLRADLVDEAVGGQQ
jgi:hypothetical protein